MLHNLGISKLVHGVCVCVCVCACVRVCVKCAQVTEVEAVTERVLIDCTSDIIFYDKVVAVLVRVEVYAGLSIHNFQLKSRQVINFDCDCD